MQGNPRLRVRAGYWTIFWTEGRRTKKQSTGVKAGGEAEPPDAAQRFLDLWIQDRDRPQDEPTMAELLDKRRDDLEARTATNPRVRSLHKAIKTRIGHTRASDIDRSRLTRYMNDRGHRVTTSRELEEIKAAFNHAHRQGWIATVPDFPTVPQFPPRERFMSPAEGRKLLRACAPLHLRVFVALGLLSGQRKGAILDLTWDRVDLGRGIVNFENPTKARTKKRRAVVHLDGRALAILQEAKDVAKSDHVVEYNCKPVGDVKKSFAEAAETAGIPWATPHVMKHSVVSWLCEKHDVAKVAEFTNTDEKTVKRIYRHTHPDAYKELSASLADDVLGAPDAVDVPNGTTAKS